MRLERSILTILFLMSAAACGGGGGGGDVDAAPSCDDQATCASMVPGGDPALASWAPADVVGACGASQAAIDALDTCACQSYVAEGGCADICDGDLNGTGNPNFCNGVGALPQCAACLQSSCDAPLADCGAN